ncbi:MAG: diguanylate cyclase [Proteobacteria bacterium]|nr:diguanylate cyclase [Pseudomonadota bacterium]
MPFSARVLVLDTDKSHPLSIGDLLDAHGYCSMHASSIEDAAKIAESSYPDLAVVNATTKDLNGGGLIESLKKAWPAQHMPLILVGDHAGAEQQTLDLVEGMADFLPHPFKDFELTSRLRSLARLSTMQGELARRHETAQKFGVNQLSRVEPPGLNGGDAIVLLARNPEDTKAITKAYSDGVKLVVVDSTYSAMTHLSTGPADALVVALASDDKETVEFCSYIRRNARLYNLPILAVADEANGIDLSEIYVAGINEVVMQPLHDADLRIRTEALIRQNTYRIAMRGEFRELRNAMTSDGLTGLYSFGFLHEHLADLIADANKREKNLTVAFFDVQGLEHVNREFGYSGGDKVLRQVAAMLGNLVRGEDVLGRHGGDQFCVILPDTSLEHAQPVVQRIAGVVTNTEFAVVEDGESIQVTLKAGVAALKPGETAELLVGRACDLARRV